MLTKQAGLLLAGVLALARPTHAQDVWTPECADMLTMQAMFMPSVMEECCDEDSEDCSNGFPSTCNARCAEVLLPMQHACSAFLSSSPMWAAMKTLIDTAAATCPIVAPAPAERDAACAADINLDQRVSTEDLLYLLATFGRDAPSRACGNPTPPPTLDATGINTMEEAREQRTYLFCALRDRLVDEASRIQDVFDVQMEDCNSTVAQLEQGLVAAEQAAQQANFATIDVAETMGAMISNLTNTILSLEQRMRTLHCPAPMIQHAEVVAGDAVYGGEGLRLQCRPGYAHDGPVTTFSFECSVTGVMVPGPDGIPQCDIMNPCTAEEDDCDPLAECSHTGPGTHSCECTNNGVSTFTWGTGQACAQCTECEVGYVPTAACTSTSDTVCEAVICDPLPTIDGVTLEYTNGQQYPTTGIYTSECGGETTTMSRTCQEDGTWTPAGEIYRCPRSCYEIKLTTDTTTDGMYTIRPTGEAASDISVYCDMANNGGGWTMIGWATPQNDLTGHSCVEADGYNPETYVRTSTDTYPPAEGKWTMPCTLVNAIRLTSTALGLADDAAGYWVTTPGSGQGRFGAETFARHDCVYQLMQTSSEVKASTCHQNQWVYDGDDGPNVWLPGGHWWDNSNSYRWFMGYHNEGHHGTGSACFETGRGLGPHSPSHAPFHRGWCGTHAWGLWFVR